MARKKVQDTVLKREDLMEKYGDTKVAVIKITPNIQKALPENKFVTHDNSIVEYKTKDRLVFASMNLAIRDNMEYLPRSEAELDETYLQPINYAVLRYKDGDTNDSWKYFCTKRLGAGDARLTGLYSIGIGGHVDEGEDLISAFYRELAEEVGVAGGDIAHYKHLGYIYDKSTAIGRVHLGIVLCVKMNHNKISVVEKDKLSGEWVTIDTLREYAEEGSLESWSEIILEELIK